MFDIPKGMEEEIKESLWKEFSDEVKESQVDFVACYNPNDPSKPIIKYIRTKGTRYLIMQAELQCLSEENQELKEKLRRYEI